MRLPSGDVSPPDHIPDRAQSWSDCDPDIRAYVRTMLDAQRVLLDGALIGAYLHGSLAMGCYYRAKSDLDVLLFVRGALPAPTRAAVARLFATHAPIRPTLGDFEASVLNVDDLAAAIHPYPYEVHYSATWTDDILADRPDFSATQHDPDLAAHLTVARARGVALFGPPPHHVIPSVPHADYLAAIGDDLAWALEEEHILESPYYTVLNVCRVWQVRVEGPGCVPSKQEGARWALPRLPDQHRDLVLAALACYRSARTVIAAERGRDGHDWNRPALLAFRDHARHLLAWHPPQSTPAPP